MWYLTVSGEDLPTYGSSSLAYYAPVIVDSDKSCCVPWQIMQFAARSGLPHDDESSQ